MDMELLLKVCRHFRRLTDDEYEAMAKMIDAGQEPHPTMLPKILDALGDAADETAAYEAHGKRRIIRVK